MKDYSLQIKVKNNYLLTKMREHGIETIAELKRRTGKAKSAPCYYHLANLSRPALTKRGNWRADIITLSKFFNCMPEELVPPQHHEEVLETNTAEIEADIYEVAAFIESTKQIGPEEYVEQKELARALTDAMGKLKPREERILRLRFGFDGECRTLEEVGNEFGVTRERIREIEAKALRHMKHPSRSRVTREFV